MSLANEKPSPTFFVSGTTVQNKRFCHELYAEDVQMAVEKINNIYRVKEITNCYLVGLIKPSQRINPIQ